MAVGHHQHDVLVLAALYLVDRETVGWTELLVQVHDGDLLFLVDERVVDVHALVRGVVLNGGDVAVREHAGVAVVVDVAHDVVFVIEDRAAVESGWRVHSLASVAREVDGLEEVCINVEALFRVIPTQEAIDWPNLDNDWNVMAFLDRSKIGSCFQS